MKEVKAKKDVAKVGSPRSLQIDWEEHATLDGTLYWYSPRDGKSVWEKPSGSITSTGAPSSYHSQ